jgi:hypothetical protein
MSPNEQTVMLMALIMTAIVALLAVVFRLVWNSDKPYPWPNFFRVGTACIVVSVSISMAKSGPLALPYFGGVLAIVLLFFLLKPMLPKGRAAPESLPPSYVAKVRRTATWVMISLLILTTIVVVMTLRGHSAPTEHSARDADQGTCSASYLALR